MPRRIAVRKPLRDDIAKFKSAGRLYGVPEDKLQTPASLAYLDRPKRAYAKRVDTGASEAQVLQSIRAAYAVHPKVAFTFRMQSGLFVDGDRHVRVGVVGMPDVIGMLKVSGRLFACEVKRESGGELSDAQKYWLNLIRSYGGLAGVARSVEDAFAIIEG